MKILGLSLIDSSVLHDLFLSFGLFSALLHSKELRMQHIYMEGWPFINFFFFLENHLRFSRFKFSSIKEAKPNTSPPSCLPNVVAMTIVHSTHVPREMAKRRRENEKTRRGDIK